MVEFAIKLSIIIPVYNAEKYLAKCLDSVLAQTFKDLEIICVDDGSKDNSLNILNEYQRRDERIKVFHKENGGANSARKLGLEKAKGTYIGFVDSDDWIESNMFERLYTLANKYDLDLVTSGYYQEGNYISISYDNIPQGIYLKNDMEDFRNQVIFNLKSKDMGVSGAFWNKLFKAKILKKVTPSIPDTIKFSEDKMTVILFALECKSAMVLKEAYYHYIMNQSSVTHSSDLNYLININEIYKFLVSISKHENFTKEMQIQAELYIIQLLIKGINTRMGFSIRNLMWIDPYWLHEIPEGKKIALYGAGDLGQKFYQQLIAYGKHSFSGCFDFAFRRMKDQPFTVNDPAELKEESYDLIVITIKNEIKANEIKKELIKLGIPNEKIKWFDEKEIFWRFAEADGLLK